MRYMYKDYIYTVQYPTVTLIFFIFYQKIQCIYHFK